MESTHSSEVSALVFRYLNTNGCQDTAQTFLKESSDLNGIRSAAVFGAQSTFLGSLSDILHDYGKAKLIVKDLVVNLLTKWKAFQEDSVSPCDTLTTQLRQINNLLSSIYDRKTPSNSRNCSPREPPQIASLIRTKRFVSTCTSEDNVLDPPPPPKQLTSSHTQTELPVSSSVETQTSCHQQTIETQTDVESQEVRIGMETSHDFPISSITAEAKTKTGIEFNINSSAMLVPSGQADMELDAPNAPNDLLGDEAKARIQVALRDYLLGTAQEQERLASLINQKYFHPDVALQGNNVQTIEDAPVANSALAIEEAPVTKPNNTNDIVEDLDSLLSHLFTQDDMPEFSEPTYMCAVESPRNEHENANLLQSRSEAVIPVTQHNGQFSIDIRISETEEQPDTTNRPEIPERPEFLKRPEPETHERSEILEQPPNQSETPERPETPEQPETPERPETPPIVIDIADSPSREAEEFRKDAIDDAVLIPEKILETKTTDNRRKPRAAPVKIRKSKPIQTKAFPEGYEADNLEIPAWNLLGRRKIDPKIPSKLPPPGKDVEVEIADIALSDTQERIDLLKTAEAVQNIPNFSPISSVATPTNPITFTPDGADLNSDIPTSSQKKLTGPLINKFFIASHKFSETHVSNGKPIIVNKKSFSTPRKKHNHVRNLQFTTPPGVSNRLSSINEEGSSKSNDSNSRKSMSKTGGETKGKKRLDWGESASTSLQGHQDTSVVVIPPAPTITIPETTRSWMIQSPADPVFVQSQGQQYTLAQVQVSDTPPVTSPIFSPGMPLSVKVIGNQTFMQCADGSLLPVQVLGGTFADTQTIGSAITEIINPVSVPINETPKSPPPARKKRGKTKTNVNSLVTSPRTLNAHYEEVIQDVIKSNTVESPVKNPMDTPEDPVSSSAGPTLRSKGKRSREFGPKSPPRKRARTRKSRKSEELAQLKTTPVSCISQDSSSIELEAWVKGINISLNNVSLPRPPRLTFCNSEPGRAPPRKAMDILMPKSATVSPPAGSRDLTSNEILSPSPNASPEDSVSKQDAWVIPPSTPRYLRQGDTVSDWDSPAHPSHNSMSTSSNFYEGLGTTYGGDTGFSSLITPVKENGVPATPGRGITLPRIENWGRAHIEATPDMTLHKKRPSPDDLNTPNPKINPAWSPPLPPPPPPPPPVPPADPVAPAPVEKIVPKEYSSSAQKDDPLKLVLKSVNPSVVSVPRNTAPIQPTVRAPIQPTVGAPIQPNVRAPIQPNVRAPIQPTVTVHAPIQPTVPSSPGQGLMKFNVGGREKRLTRSETESVYSLLSMGISVTSSTAPLPKTTTAKPVTQNKPASAKLHTPSENSGPSKIQMIKQVNIDKLLRKLHPEQNKKT